MRKTLILNYLYICALSILSQSPSCLAQTANLSASSDGQVCSNGGHTLELKENEAQLRDETNQRMQRGRVIDKQTDSSVRQVRRKRELRDAASSNPSGRASSAQRVKKSEHPMDQNLRKLVSKKNNVKISSGGEENVQEDQPNQEKRDLRRQRGSPSRASFSPEDVEAKSGRKAAKRSSYSSEAVRISKSKSRAIKESDSVAQGSFAKEKLKVQDSGRYADLSDDHKAEKPESGNDQLEDEADLEENSAEYEEAGDDDDDREAPARNAGYRKSNLAVSQAGEEPENLDQVQSSAEDDDSEKQDVVKRDTAVAEEEYEDIEDQDEACEDASLVDESNYQQSKARSGPGLLKKREIDDGREERHDSEPSENKLDKNEAPNPNESANQQLKTSEHLEEAKKDPDDNSKREVSQTATGASSDSSFRPQGKYLKRQVSSENLATEEANGPVDLEAESSKREAETGKGDKSNAGEQSDTRLDSEKGGSGDNVNEEVKKDAKVGAENKSEIEDSGKGPKQESNADPTVKDNDSNSDYEKKVEEQIQQKIESIKESIKREVEEKERIREIEENNAKYDQIQSETEEDEDEDNQSLDIPTERKSVLKRSIIDGIRRPQAKTKRHILRRVKRSDTTDPRQLRSIEGVDKLDPDVLTKAQLRHESIRKRSAPVYGAVDKDAPDTSQPLLKRSANPRKVYLVNNEQKRSPISMAREVRDTMIIPEQAHVNIEDELPPGLSVDPSLLEGPSPAKYRLKRSPDRFARRRRASAVIPDGRVAFLGYRPQDDDENDEGSEFDDDGFEDRTSNLEQDKSYAAPHAPVHDQYHADEPGDENPASFLFSGVDSGREDFLVRRKRAGIRDDEEPARLHGGGALTRRQTRAKAKQMQTAKIRSRKNFMDRDKRQTENGVDDAKSDSVASLVESSQELSPKLATEYKEAFGGLQSDPGGALARFKRVKRDALRTGFVD